MPITPSVEPPKVILTPTGTLTVQDVSTLAATFAQSAATYPQGTAIEWRPDVTPVPNPEWQHWARHYDTLAWQVSSIFTAASVILAGGYVNARVNWADSWIQSVIAVAGVGLILFQMFIVGAFRTYRYDLYKALDPKSPALDMYRKWTGTPWVVYCLVAWIATWPWLHAFWRLWSLELAGLVGIGVTVTLAIIGVWATPPIIKNATV